jgi:hypothetical protein
MSFPVWDAAIAAGATLHELYLLDYGRPLPVDGTFPQPFLGKVVAWHVLSRQVSLHSQDAQIIDQERRAKLKGKK